MASLQPSVSINRGQYNAKKSRPSLPKHFSKTTLEAAIDANRALKLTLHNELIKITQSIYQNRAEVAHYTNQLLQKSSPKSQQQQLSTDSSIEETNYCLARCPKRKWTKRFFVDHNGTEPKLNTDTLRRRKIEKETFFYHIQPPWSSKETVQLMHFTDSIVNTNAKNESAQLHKRKKVPKVCRQDHSFLETEYTESTMSGSIDFDTVAMSLAQPQRESGERVLQQIHQRTSEECQIQYQKMKKQEISRNLFGTQEELHVLSHVVTSMLSSVGPTNMDWNIVAEQATAALQHQPRTYRLSGWDCLVAYHMKLKSPLTQLQTTSSSWTIQEDELLLKFLASAGPQAVIDSKNSLVQNALLTQLLYKKSKKQLYARVNHSLLNPNMIKNEWIDYEERRLPICMKIYYSPNHEDSNQLYCASTHCYGRSTKSVVDKWNRSINPVYSTGPFTLEEDEALLHVMRSSLVPTNETDCSTEQKRQHIGWTDLSQKYFPNRHPQRLQNRWSELATDQDIISRERAKLLNKISTNVGGVRSDCRQRRKRRHSNRIDDFSER